MAILCADDYGMTEGISEGILALCRAGKLNATSAMTEAPLLPVYAPKLMTCPGVQVGLHFNLTTPFAKKAFSRNFLMLRPALSAVDRAEVTERLREQMQDFENIFGRAPDFIDGHEHVHVMPSVRPIFLKEIAARYRGAAKKPWIRQVANPLRSTDTKLKAFVLNILNTGFRADCKKHGLKTNTAFAGVYSFNPQAPYGDMMKKWLQGANSNTLIMCHPSAQQEDGDAISQARVREFAILSNLTA